MTAYKITPPPKTKLNPNNNCFEIIVLSRLLAMFLFYHKRQ
ncbi:hypothetical protein [Moraxella lacunata]